MARPGFSDVVTTVWPRAVVDGGDTAGRDAAAYERYYLDLVAVLRVALVGLAVHIRTHFDAPPQGTGDLPDLARFQRLAALGDNGGRDIDTLPVELLRVERTAPPGANLSSCLPMPAPCASVVAPGGDRPGVRVVVAVRVTLPPADAQSPDEADRRPPRQHDWLRAPMHVLAAVLAQAALLDVSKIYAWPRSSLFTTLTPFPDSNWSVNVVRRRVPLLHPWFDSDEDESGDSDSDAEEEAASNTTDINVFDNYGLSRPHRAVATQVGALLHGWARDARVLEYVRASLPIAAEAPADVVADQLEWAIVSATSIYDPSNGGTWRFVNPTMARALVATRRPLEWTLLSPTEPGADLPFLWWPEGSTPTAATELFAMQGRARERFHHDVRRLATGLAAAALTM